LAWDAVIGMVGAVHDYIAAVEIEFGVGGAGRRG
jgi:hypothetical protein